MRQKSVILSTGSFPDLLDSGAIHGLKYDSENTYLCSEEHPKIDPKGDSEINPKINPSSSRRSITILFAGDCPRECS